MKRRNTEKIFNLLFEEDPKSDPAPESPVASREPSVKTRPAPDSVDDQIDALILRYENSSIKSGPSTLSESLTNLDLSFLIEQDEMEADTETDPAAADAGAEEGGGDEAAEPTGSEEMGVTEPAEDQAIPPLDIDAFSSRVVRLIMNHSNLLQIENAIINRTKNFLDENYGDKFVSKFLEVIDEQYGISVSEDNVEYPPDDEIFGVGANPAGAGMTGA